MTKQTKILIIVGTFGAIAGITLFFYFKAKKQSNTIPDKSQNTGTQQKGLPTQIVKTAQVTKDQPKQTRTK